MVCCEVISLSFRHAFASNVTCFMRQYERKVISHDTDTHERLMVCKISKSRISWGMINRLIAFPAWLIEQKNLPIGCKYAMDFTVHASQYLSFWGRPKVLRLHAYVYQHQEQYKVSHA
jgi:hypothetical protein